MTILQVIHRFDFGGSENHVCDISNALAAKGHRVIVAGGEGRQHKKLAQNVNYIKANTTLLLLPVYVIKLILITKKYNANVIHAHQRLSILAASIAGYLTNTRVIATIHGRAKYDVRSILSRKIPHRLIFVSSKVLEYALKRYPIQNKSVVIPNGINIGEHETNPTPYKICYVSRIDRAHMKMLTLLTTEVMPQLINNFGETHLEIIGDGNQKAELIKMVNELNDKTGRTVCNVLGYSNSVTTSLHSASIVLGVGRVALEAISMGIPVISVNSKRFSGIISASNYEQIKFTNFIDSAAPKPKALLLTSAIKNIFTNFPLAINESRMLKEKAHNDFSMDMVINQLVQLYTNG
ncbi:MAG TPA: glycosyltransferase [Bacteroidetes bacterium]|nr:glycosyltransferase [Bacteroidota bacterium]